jgi:hypothetical protein
MPDVSPEFVTASDQTRPMSGFCWADMGIVEENASVPRELPRNARLIKAL